jgi:opacity protein-like surface antigen
VCAAALAACSVVRLSAQTPSSATPPEPVVRLRAFALATEQRFAAATTFNATLGSRYAPFFGGGVEVVIRRGLFVDATVSHLDKTGQRAFVNNGQIFQLGIPLTITMTPVEVSGGYRLSVPGHARVVPYAGAGVGWYSYRETSDFASSGENVDTTHAGFLLVGGAEVRLQRWIRAAADAQYTAIPSILGQGGLSKDLNERGLGGLAARIRVILGR